MKCEIHGHEMVIVHDEDGIPSEEPECVECLYQELHRAQIDCETWENRAERAEGKLAVIEAALKG